MAASASSFLSRFFWSPTHLKMPMSNTTIPMQVRIPATHGNIEIKEFMNYLSAMFNIDLGGYYDAYIAMKERKDRTSYLNKLIENLTKRMDEDDIR